MKHVVFYQSGHDITARAREHFPAHQAWYLSFHERGQLLMIGPFRCVPPRVGHRARPRPVQ